MCHSREGGNPYAWTPAFAGVASKFVNYVIKFSIYNSKEEALYGKEIQRTGPLSAVPIHYLLLVGNWLPIQRVRRKLYGGELLIGVCFSPF